MVLVTGGTGLLGSHLLYALVKQDCRVRALKRSSSDLRNVKQVFAYYDSAPLDLFNRIEWVDGELEDIYSLLQAMEGVEKVYHCAAMVSFASGSYDHLLKINVEGTANMINAALEKKVGKFCHVSSVAALGKSLNEVITEETPWKHSSDVSGYSLSKYGAEREAWRGIEEGLNVVIVNPSIIIGPGNWENGSSNMFHSSFKGIKCFTGGSSGFVDVKDVVSVMLNLMAGDTNKERFIVSAENLEYKRFFDLTHEHLKKPKPGKKAGKLLSGLAWRSSFLRSSLTGKKPLITKETARAAQKCVRYSNEKIRNKINFEFQSIEKSIEEICNLYLKDLSKAN